MINLFTYYYCPLILGATLSSGIAGLGGIIMVFAGWQAYSDIQEAANAKKKGDPAWSNGLMAAGIRVGGMLIIGALFTAFGLKDFLIMPDKSALQ